MEEINNITIESLYNQNTLIKDGVSLDEKNQFILSPELINEGWNVGMGFQEKSNPKSISDEIQRLKFLKYETGIAILRDGIRCIIYKDNLKKLL